LFLVFSWCS